MQGERGLPRLAVPGNDVGAPLRGAVNLGGLVMVDCIEIQAVGLARALASISGD